jgi:hypothetical protein
MMSILATRKLARKLRGAVCYAAKTVAVVVALMAIASGALGVFAVMASILEWMRGG